MLFVAQYGVCILLGRGQKKKWGNIIHLRKRYRGGQSCCLFTWVWVNCSFNEKWGLNFDEDNKMSSKLDHENMAEGNLRSFFKLIFCMLILISFWFLLIVNRLILAFITFVNIGLLKNTNYLKFQEKSHIQNVWHSLKRAFKTFFKEQLFNFKT